MAQLVKGHSSSPNAGIVKFVLSVIHHEGLPTGCLMRIDKDANLWLLIADDRKSFTVMQGSRHSAKKVVATVPVADRFTRGRILGAREAMKAAVPNSMQASLIENARKAEERQVRFVESALPRDVVDTLVAATV